MMIHRFIKVASILILPVLASAQDVAVRVDPGTESRMESAADRCRRYEKLFQQAKDSYEAKRFDESLGIIDGIGREAECEFTHVQALGLQSRILIFESKQYAAGSKAAAKCVDLDPDQWGCWFSQAYAQYYQDRFD